MAATVTETWPNGSPKSEEDRSPGPGPGEITITTTTYAEGKDEDHPGTKEKEVKETWDGVNHLISRIVTAYGEDGHTVERVTIETETSEIEQDWVDGFNKFTRVYRGHLDKNDWKLERTIEQDKNGKVVKIS